MPMDIDDLEKDESIKDLLRKLYHRLGDNSFDVVDHWEADLTAIGIGNPSNHNLLIYISTYSKGDNDYYVSLEIPNVPGAGFTYPNAGEFDCVNFDRLVELIREQFVQE